MIGLRAFVFALGVVRCALASEPACTGPPAKPPHSQLDWPPLIMVMRGEHTWLGDFDKDGNFIRDPHFPANYYRNGGSVVHRGVIAIYGRQMPVCEHRSGRLIRGTSVDKPLSVFVPEIGSTVTDLAKFDLKNPDRIVWNLVETGPAFWTEERKKQLGYPPPKGAVPPKAGTPAGFEFTLFRELAHDKKAPAVARVIGEVMEVGRLSDEGEFVPDPDLPLFPRTVAAHTHPPVYAANTFNFYYTLPRPKTELEERPQQEDVYEYRSGRLIQGALHKTGNFVPELGSKVLDFKDYDPLGRRRIYNLPGVLRKTAK